RPGPASSPASPAVAASSSPRPTDGVNARIARGGSVVSCRSAVPLSARSLRTVLPALLVGTLASGCASTPTGGAASAGEHASAQSAEQARFLADCREGCEGEPDLCERFCTCSVGELQSSPEL